MSPRSRARCATWCPTRKSRGAIKRQGGKVWHGDLLKEETYKKIKLHYVDQAIVFMRDADLQDRVCRLLRSLDKMVSIVSLTSENNGNHKETRRSHCCAIFSCPIFSKSFARRSCSIR